MRFVLALSLIGLVLSCSNSDSKVAQLEREGGKPPIVSPIEPEPDDPPGCDTKEFEEICLNLALEKAPENSTKVLYSLSEMKEGAPSNFQYKLCSIGYLQSVDGGSEESQLGSFKIFNDKECRTESVVPLHNGSVAEPKSGEMPDMDQV